MRPTILVLLLVSGCAVNPVTGKSQLSLYSEGSEIQMGQQELANAKVETGFYTQNGIEGYVAGIGKRMASEGERPGLPWEFHVVDDPAVNAFAAPGGFIFVTRGILAYLNSEAELASVVGHEVGHVNAKHSVTSASVQQLLGGGLGLLSIWRPGIANVVGTGASLGLLKYSRDHESQADELGHRYALHDQYDVREMPNTFRTLARLEAVGGGSSGRLPSLFSTHPDPGDRVTKTQAWADTITNTKVLHTDRDRYLDHINGILYGIDPQQGYFEGSRYLHPEMKLRFDMPSGWQGMNQATQVLVGEPNGQAQLALTVASQGSLDAAAQAFLGQQGLQNPASQRTTINGQAGIVGTFDATSQDNQQLKGEVVFVQMNGRIMQFMGLAVAQAWNTLSGPINASLRSLAPTPSNQQFRQRVYIHIITLSQPTSVDALAQRSNGAVTAQMLAILNGVGDGTTLPAGRRVKTVGP